MTRSHSAVNYQCSNFDRSAPFATISHSAVTLSMATKNWISRQIDEISRQISTLVVVVIVVGIGDQFFTWNNRFRNSRKMLIEGTYTSEKGRDFVDFWISIGQYLLSHCYFNFLHSCLFSKSCLLSKDCDDIPLHLNCAVMSQKSSCCLRFK